MTALTLHMKKRGLSNQMQMEVKKYFEYFFEEEDEDNEEGERMLSGLT